MDPTEIDPGWVDLVPGCVVSIDTSQGEGREFGRVTSQDVALDGRMFLVDAQNVELSAYRLTYAPDPNAAYFIRYTPPPGWAGEPPPSYPRPIDDPVVLAAVIVWMRRMEIGAAVTFLGIDPPA